MARAGRQDMAETSPLCGRVLIDSITDEYGALIPNSEPPIQAGWEPCRTRVLHGRAEHETFFRTTNV